MRILITIGAVLALTACSSMTGKGAYESGLDANVAQYKLFSDVQLAQQQALQTCYQYNPNKSECAINQASTNAVQTLAGQPKPLRVAESVGEIMKSIAKDGFEATKIIYGVKAVTDAVAANSLAMRDMATANSAAQASTAQAGIEAASKPPLVVRPEVIQVPVGSAPLVTPTP